MAGDAGWSWTSTCDDGAFDAVADDVADGDRHLTLRGSALPEVTGGGCELTVAIGLRRGGRVSGRFADGSTIHAVRERSLTVRLVP
jgi:hypothetical protein